MGTRRATRKWITHVAILVKLGFQVLLIAIGLDAGAPVGELPAARDGELRTGARGDPIIDLISASA